MRKYAIREIKAKLHSDKGSTLFMSVITLLFLTVILTALIVASSVHFQTVTAYSKNATTFNDIEGDALEKLKNMDDCLRQAEEIAKAYIDEGGYKLDPVISSNNFTYDGLNLKNFKNDDDYGIHMDINNPDDDPLSVDEVPYVQYFYNRWVRFNENNTLVDEAAYNAALSQLTDNIYREVYFIVAEDKLSSQFEGGDYDHDYSTIDCYSSGEYGPNYTISFIQRDSNNKNPLHIAVNITLPTYTTDGQMKHSYFKVNPVYTNALTAQGDIIIRNAKTKKILGDVNTRGSLIVENSGETEKNKLLVEGNIYASANVNLQGQELIVSSRNSNNSNSNTDVLKKHLYTNSALKEYYLNYSNGNGLSLDTFVRNQSNINFNFIYQDDRGGNIYATDVEETSTRPGSKIQCNNLWIANDVTLDGDSSEINILGTTLGLSSEASVNNNSPNPPDPTASSTIINNSYSDTTSSIKLGQFYIPGLVYLEFKDQHGVIEYYQTVESITSNSPEIFTSLYDLTINELKSSINDSSIDYDAMGINSSDIHTYSHGSFQYDLIDSMYNLRNEASFRTNHLGQITGVSTGILFDHSNNPLPDLPSYSTGAVIAKNAATNGDYKAHFFERGVDTNLIGDYNTLKGNFTLNGNNTNHLSELFSVKTTKFGLENGETDLTSYISSTVEGKYVYKPLGQSQIQGNTLHERVTYLSGSSPYTLELAGDVHGILVVDGDLRITSPSNNGKFMGSIICTGEVIIEDLVEIHYHEGTIEKLLTRSEAVRQFFAPHTQGDSVGFQISSGKHGYFTGNVSRLDVKDWSYRPN